MVSSRILRVFEERPEFLLALGLSAPSKARSVGPRTFTVELERDDVILRLPRLPHHGVGPRLVATKQTIAAAVLLHHLLEVRGYDYGQEMLETLAHSARQAAEKDASVSQRELLEFGFSSQYSTLSLAQIIREQLKVQPDDMEASLSKTVEALTFLEDEGLAVDPAFTPEIMVLLGFVPMHFSVRTPRGDRVHRELKIDAPLWKFGIKWGTQHNRTFRDVDFEFRGINFVRSALTTIATNYLEGENKARQRKGLPTLPRKGQPSLDEQDD